MGTIGIDLPPILYPITRQILISRMGVPAPFTRPFLFINRQENGVQHPMRKTDERRVGLIEPYAGALHTGIVYVIAAQYHHMGYAVSVNVTECRMIEKVSTPLAFNRD